MSDAYARALSKIQSCGGARLDLSGMGLTALPPQIADLKTLTDLDLSRNELKSLPPEIGNLSELIWLDLEDNRLTSLPREIGNLCKLEHLYLHGNRLSGLPVEIGSLTNLSSLYLNDNQLTFLPAEIGNLRALRWLTVYDNQLTSFPREIGNLTSLIDLFAGGNRLSSIPVEMGNLRSLTSLYLHSNRLTSLPVEIGSLPKLSELYINGNPLPREILALEPKPNALLAYLREQKGASALREVKLVFLGPPEIGKSCLLRHLQKKPFLKGYQTTIGFDIAQEALTLGGGDDAIQANCWDFGGQPKYEVTHQFFFSKENLFVVAWKPRQGPAELTEWLQLVKHRAGDEAPIMVVATHRDESEHTADLDEAHLRKRFPGIREFFWVTNLDQVSEDHKNPVAAEQAIEDSKVEFQRLSDALLSGAKDRIIQEFPEGRRQAREKVRSLQATSISLKECRKLWSEHLPDESVEPLLLQLNAIGDVVFHPSGDIDNLIILRPQWLGKAIGFVMDDPLLKPGDGEVDHASLVLVWDQYAKQEGYSPKHYPYFLWLMEQFDLAYRLSERRSLIPQLVRNERPTVPFCPWDKTTGGHQCAYQWTVKGTDAPKGLVPVLTSALNPWRGPSKEQRNWKNGLALTTVESQRAFIELNDRVLLLATRADFPATIAEELRSQVASTIAEVWPGVRIDLEYPCKSCVANRAHPVGGYPVEIYEGYDDAFPLVCPSCGDKSTLGELKRGYRIDLEWDRLRAQLEKSQVVTAEMAAMLQRVLLLSSNYPNKCVLAEAESTLKDVGHDVYALHLYCDHPKHKDQPVASYPVKLPKKWLKVVKGVAHWTGIIAKGAGLAVPALKVIEGATLVEMPDEVLSLAIKGVETLSASDIEVIEDLGPRESSETDAYRRFLHELLQQVGQDGKYYGGLNRELHGTAVRWFCNDHRDTKPTMD